MTSIGTVILAFSIVIFGLCIDNGLTNIANAIQEKSQ